jgi:hypothetical protein
MFWENDADFLNELSNRYILSNELGWNFDLFLDFLLFSYINGSTKLNSMQAVGSEKYALLTCFFFKRLIFIESHILCS